MNDTQYIYYCTKCGNDNQDLITDEFVMTVPKSSTKHGITMEHAEFVEFTGYSQCEECSSDMIDQRLVEVTTCTTHG